MTWKPIKIENVILKNSWKGENGGKNVKFEKIGKK